MTWDENRPFTDDANSLKIFFWPLITYSEFQSVPEVAGMVLTLARFGIIIIELLLSNFKLSNISTLATYIPGLTSPYLKRECDGVGGWTVMYIQVQVVNVQVQIFNDLMNSLSSMAPLRSLDPLFLLLP